MTKGRLFFISVAVSLVLTMTLQFIQPTNAYAADSPVTLQGASAAVCVGCNVSEMNNNGQVVTSFSAGGASAAGGNQANTGGDLTGATVGVTGSTSTMTLPGTGTNVAQCFGCAVTIIDQSSSVPGTTSAVLSASGVSTTASPGGFQITAGGVAATGGTQVNMGGNLKGAAVSASSGPSEVSIAACFGCNVSEVNGNVQRVTAASAGNVQGVSAVGGDQSNSSGSVSGAAVAASGAGISIALCFGCNVIEINTNSQLVSASSLGTGGGTVSKGTQGNATGSVTAATVSATGTGLNVALCIGCNVVVINRNSEQVVAGSLVSAGVF